MQELVPDAKRYGFPVVVILHHHPDTAEKISPEAPRIFAFTRKDVHCSRRYGKRKVTPVRIVRPSALNLALPLLAIELKIGGNIREKGFDTPAQSFVFKINGKLHSH